MNKSILLSLISIFAVVGLVGGLSFAYFSDQGTSTDNIFASGTLILKLANGAGSDQNDVTATWSGSNMEPGDSTTVGTLNLKNTGTVVGSHVDIAFANSNTGSVNPLDEVMWVTTLTYDGTDLLTGLNTSTPNTYGLIDTNDSSHLELSELAAQDLVQHNLALINKDIAHPLVMQLEMSPYAGNDYQGGSVTTDLTVTLQQDVSQ